MYKTGGLKGHDDLSCQETLIQVSLGPLYVFHLYFFVILIIILITIFIIYLFMCVFFTHLFLSLRSQESASLLP